MIYQLHIKLKNWYDKDMNIVKLNELLKNLFPEAKCVLRYSSAWELLVAVILSAQCTDNTVNRITEKLFKKYRSIDDYVGADKKTFEKDIYQAGFYKQKTQYILGSAKIIKEKHHGIVPKTMKELTSLPGVGRKTANVVLGNAYEVVEGIAVDTHVKRLSRKFGLTRHTDPAQIEKDLMRQLPKSEWTVFTYRMIEFGRRYCKARKHDHKKCIELVG